MFSRWHNLDSSTKYYIKIIVINSMSFIICEYERLQWILSPNSPLALMIWTCSWRNYEEGWRIYRKCVSVDSKGVPVDRCTQTWRTWFWEVKNYACLSTTRLYLSIVWRPSLYRYGYTNPRRYSESPHSGTFTQTIPTAEIHANIQQSSRSKRQLSPFIHHPH